MMHIHLDAVGGIAGNMFIAAVLDTFPEWAALLPQQITHAGFNELVHVGAERKSDGVLRGRYFVVNLHQAAFAAPVHRPYRLICETLSASALSFEVKQHALGIFNLLAQAEAEVHGTTIDAVEFHEVGAWDSIADVVCAAFLIDQLNNLDSRGPCTWSVSPLPLGRGRVQSAHGVLPVPAPAVTLLLKNFEFVQDELEGERITPTGAAILNYLIANNKYHQGEIPQSLVLQHCGNGFGSRSFPGISNVLRMLVFRRQTNSTQRWNEDTVLKIEFEVDDQSAEDIGIAVEKMRELTGVLDVCQFPVFAKKGRVATSIQVLAAVNAESNVLAMCFNQFTTLGLRKQVMQRVVLARENIDAHRDGAEFQVKLAKRPNGTVTAKVAADDLAAHGSTQSAREQLRYQLQTDALVDKNGKHGDK